MDVPILPVYIKGAYEALPKGALLPVPRSVEIRFSNPIMPQDYRELKGKIPNYEIYQRITEKLRKQIVELMKEA